MSRKIEIIHRCSPEEMMHTMRTISLITSHSSHSPAVKRKIETPHVWVKPIFLSGSSTILSWTNASPFLYIWMYDSHQLSSGLAASAAESAIHVVAWAMICWCTGAAIDDKWCRWLRSSKRGCTILTLVDFVRMGDEGGWEKPQHTDVAIARESAEENLIVDMSIVHTAMPRRRLELAVFS